MAYILFQLMLFKFFRPGFLTTFLFIGLGFGIGMGLSYLFYQNKKRKRELNEVLMYDPGVKGMQCLLKELPSWVSYTEKEKMEWLNKMLVELWPYYDKAICDTIKEQVEPMIAQYTPPTFKRIFFKQLTFGDAPFRVESIHVMESRKDVVVMEVQVRWCGDANITIGVDLPAGGDATRMCPKVSDISFVGHARVALYPLVDTIPCFGAAMVSLKSPPIVKFKLDFGKALGSGYTAGAIRAFLDPLIRETMVDMLLWPQRIVVPIIWGDPEVDKAVEEMQLRNQGVLRVTVDRCSNLNSYDIGGKSDPIVELYIDPTYRPETKCAKNNLNPVYGETFYLLVQEPTDQMLRIVVSDIDLINAKELLNVKVWKGITNAVNSKTFMGRSMIQIRDICSAEGTEVAHDYPLGRGEWSDLNGPGKGEGTVHLTCMYKSFQTITTEDLKQAQRGIVVVTIRKVKNLDLASKNSAFYVVVKCGKQTQRTRIVKGQGPDYNFAGSADSKFAFYNVEVSGEVKIEVSEYTMLGADDSLGKLSEIYLAEVADSCDLGQHGLYLIDDRTAPGTVRHGSQTVRRCQLTEVDKGEVIGDVRFLPHFGPPSAGSQAGSGSATPLSPVAM